jgi:putative membrane-bound dehydrogenase-like protein
MPKRSISSFIVWPTCMFIVLTAMGQPAPSGGDSNENLPQLLKPIPPKEPADALNSIEVIDGFHMELVAHEPMVFDPVSGAFDEDGRLYVTELLDYPYQPAHGAKPRGRVRLLEDTDGDGVFDRSTVFAENLLWPSGVAVWKGGVFVAATPDIWYFKDTNNDGRADIRRRMYSGFGTEKSQGSLNNLIWGMDHQIYGAGSKNGGEVLTVGDSASDPIRFTRSDIRFDPVSEQIEAVSGGAQFGNSFDDWGNRFLCSQAHPLHQVVLPQRYLARNPYLPASKSVSLLLPQLTPIYRISPIETWRTIRSQRRIEAGERTADSAGASHNVLDGVAGTTVYRGDAYPQSFYGNVFAGGAQNNLIHRRTLESNGVTFTSHRTERDTEFVRSSDLWFRPVNFLNAPDGTLYVLDLAREFLETVHIPLDVAAYMDLTSGRDRGRIFRIAPDGFHYTPPPRFSTMPTVELVTQLENGNGWRRDTAHRLIFERQDPVAIPALRQMLVGGSRPQARLLALWALEGLSDLSESDLEIALRDSAPQVREHAVRLSESHLDHSPRLIQQVLALADDDNTRVRFQVAFSLGETQDPRATTALARIAQQDASDSWMRVAMLSSSAQRASTLLAELLAIDSDGVASMLQQLATMIGVRNQNNEITTVLDHAASVSSQIDTARQQRIILGLADGMRQSGSPEARLNSVTGLSPAATRMLDSLIAGAINAIQVGTKSESQLVRSIRVLEEGRFEIVHQPLESVLSPVFPRAAQLEAVRVLSRFDNPRVPGLLIGQWERSTPDVRSQIFDSMVAKPQWIAVLLDAMRTDAIPIADADPSRRASLRTHLDPAIRRQAESLFGKANKNNRQEVVDRLTGSLDLTGDPLQGKAVFGRACAICHRLGDTGVHIGPNLTLTSQKNPRELLESILNPNREVDPNYIQYIVMGAGERAHTGVIVSESATSVTIRQLDSEQIFLRQNIQRIISTGLSFMPEGLEQDINLQQMSDLLTYLLDVQYDIGTEPGGFSPAEND